MLKAVLHGKAGRVQMDGSNKVSWGALFKTHEDLMTAAIFSRFAYLSSPVQASLLKSWLGNINIKHDFEQFEDIEFWSKFDLVNNKNRRFVEPDLVLRFKEFNLIIEVKPPAGGDQYIEQWRREISSFFQSDDKSDLPLYFLAIGRINHHNAKSWRKVLIDENSSHLITVSAIEWQPVADSIVQLRHPKQNVKKHNSLTTTQDVRILDDIIDALQLYGLKTANFQWKHLLQLNILPTLSSNHFYLSDWKNSLEKNKTPYQDASFLSLEKNNFNSINLYTMTLWQGRTNAS